MKSILFLFLLTALVAPQEKEITFWMIGDSTMSVKQTTAYPETGWGMPFVHFWDASVKVDNRAMNGRSTSSFRSEGRWDPVLENMKEGDYVFIQFGHNDEVITKKTYTTEREYKANLNRFVEETRAKKAIPVLITPVARRRFNESDKVIGTHDVYSQLVRQLAMETRTPLIDLDIKGQELIQKFGVEHSKLLFLHLQPDEHPNYPDGKTDDTHFSELGARLVAEIVLKELKAVCPELGNRVIKPGKK